MKKSSEFLRTNTSLARNALVMECINNEFGKEVFEAAKQNDKNQTINTLVDLKIPLF